MFNLNNTTSALIKNLIVVNPKEFTGYANQLESQPVDPMIKKNINIVLSDIDKILIDLGNKIHDIIPTPGFKPGLWLPLRASSTEDLYPEVWTRDAAISWQIILSNHNQKTKTHVQQEELDLMLIAIYSSLSLLSMVLVHLRRDIKCPLRFDSPDPNNRHNRREFFQLINSIYKRRKIHQPKPLHPVYANTSVLFTSDMPVDLIPMIVLLLSEIFDIANKHQLPKPINQEILNIKHQTYSILAEQLNQLFQKPTEPHRSKNDGYIVEPNVKQTEQESNKHNSLSYLLISGSNSFWADSTITLTGAAYSYPNVLLQSALRKIVTDSEERQEKSLKEKWGERATRNQQAIRSRLINEDNKMLNYALKVNSNSVQILTTASANIMRCIYCLDPRIKSENMEAKQILEQIDEADMLDIPIREIQERVTLFNNPGRIIEGFVNYGLPQYHINHSWPWLAGEYIVACKKHGLINLAKKCATNLKSICENNQCFPEVVNQNRQIAKLPLNIRTFSKSQSWTIAATIVALQTTSP